MKLSKLTERFACTLLAGSWETEITDLVYDSRKAAPGTLFIAINGFRTDSHRFLPQVAEQGASAVLIEKDWEDLPKETQEALLQGGQTVLKAPDGREALACLSAALFGYPTEELTVIGITGTKGKTTTSYMLTAILEEAGFKTGLIGTNEIRTGKRTFASHNTTPEPYDTQCFAREMVEAGCRFLVMEVSSTGIKYHRADAIDFDLGIFTNISPDHIGTLEHPDFEDYLANKAKLFARCPVGLFNRDEEKLPMILKTATCEIHTFGFTEKDPYPYPDFAACDLRFEKKDGVLGTSVTLKGPKESFDFFVGMPGDFNVANAMGAVGAARLLGISEEAIRRALAHIRVTGRVEVVYSSDFATVMLDYAHNGVSATALFTMLRDYDPGRIVVIFGAEGGRAQVRRQELGEVCGKLADFCILSSQNPDFEPLEDIFRDIHVYLDPTGTPSVDIPDRHEAAERAEGRLHRGHREGTGRLRAGQGRQIPLVRPGGDRSSHQGTGLEGVTWSFRFGRSA